MKKLFITIAVLTALALPAFAQFHGSANYTRDLVNGTATVVSNTASITNIIYIGKDGFNITPTCVGTNASATNWVSLQIQPLPDGKTIPTSGATTLGVVILTGTTPIRSMIQTNGTIYPGCGMAQLVVSNGCTTSITISNLTLGAW